MLRALLKRIRDAAETDTGIALTLHEGLMIDAKFFELEQLVLDQRRLIDFLRVDEKTKERAAVVEWLSRVEKDCVDISIWTRQIRDAVKNGEHQKEHIAVED